MSYFVFLPIIIFVTLVKQFLVDVFKIDQLTGVFFIGSSKEISEAVFGYTVKECLRNRFQEDHDQFLS